MGKKKKTEIEKLVELVPEDKRMIAERLLEELSFMDETLEQLKGEVRKRGAVDEFKQGKQEFLRESPALKAYNTTIQRYSLLSKQLADLLPKQAQDNAETALLDFLKEG